MAMDDLGVLYKERALGKGKGKDAWSYFLRAAGLGYRGGEFHLGECYYEGIGVEQDLEKAVTCYKRALAHGSMEAADALGTMAVLGEGMPADEKAAFTYFRTAVKGGYIASLYKLGDCHYYGRGTAQDFGRARDLFEKAWDNGDKAAAVRMGDYLPVRTWGGTGQPEGGGLVHAVSGKWRSGWDFLSRRMRLVWRRDGGR